jgi:hypothetical protein
LLLHQHIIDQPHAFSGKADIELIEHFLEPADRLACLVVANHLLALETTRLKYHYNNWLYICSQEYN